MLRTSAVECVWSKSLSVHHGRRDKLRIRGDDYHLFTNAGSGFGNASRSDAVEMICSSSVANKVKST
jgi:hypothetical protein